MLIINRYVMKEVLVTLLGVLAILFLIFLSTRFIQFLAAAASGMLPTNVVLTLLGLKALSALADLLPYSLYIAVLLAFGRLYKDSEMVALAACGIGTRKIVRVILGFSIMTAVIVGAASLYFAPWAEEQSSRIRDQVKASAEVIGLAPGRFSESGSGNGVFFAEEISRDGQSLRNIFMQASRDKSVETLSSEHGAFVTDPETGRRFLVLKNGYRYEWQPGVPQVNIVQFEEHGVLLREREVEESTRRHQARATDTLLASDDLTEIAEFQRRVSMPVITILLGLLAVPLSRTSPRRGRYAKLFTAILILVIYSNILGVAQSWFERGVTPPSLGIWWVHAVFLVFVLIVYVRQMGLTWTMRVLAGKDV
ncbi:MAG: lipopolysaccharide export system permease protein [Gammaproteobacteria bacterium]|nr:MAG: lipopolysaccharide export system permease protein [Gammaproteobacteria bacterium]TND06630.1 MAG: lipopolysaccharide export system permease protein [Gammaproteobacteria bacterium]